MRFGEEIVGIHGSRQHGCKTSCSLVGFHCGGEDDEVCVDMYLLIADEVRALYEQFFTLRNNLANRTLDVVDPVILDGAAVNAGVLAVDVIDLLHPLAQLRDGIDELDHLMKLELLVTREDMATELQKRFKEKAETLYSRILAVLYEDETSPK